MTREQFEAWVLRTRIQSQPFGLVERSGEGYLDLYTQKEWQGWQAASEAISFSIAAMKPRIQGAAYQQGFFDAKDEALKRAEYLPHVEMDGFPVL